MVCLCGDLSNKVYFLFLQLSSHQYITLHDNNCLHEHVRKLQFLGCKPQIKEVGILSAFASFSVFMPMEGSKEASGGFRTVPWLTLLRFKERVMLKTW